MQRTIKFRAWDSANAKMIQVKQLKQTAERYLNNGELKYFDYPLMQYTGLKDKQGKEIYEGDIVEVECECGFKDKMPVEWRHNGYRLNQKWSHRFPSGELEFCHPERTEVIGNIYENSELLKETT